MFIKYFVAVNIKLTLTETFTTWYDYIFIWQKTCFAL